MARMRSKKEGARKDHLRLRTLAKIFLRARLMKKIDFCTAPTFIPPLFLLKPVSASSHHDHPCALLHLREG